MELSPKQQVTELVRKFNRILVVTHARPDGDALGSLLATQMVLEKLGKDVTAVMRDDIPEMLRFLPGIDKLSKDLTGGRDLVVSVDTSKVPVDKLKYNTRDDKLNVVITPKDGRYEERDVTIRSGSYNFDLIISLDAPDLDRVGSLFEDHPDLFYETPVVNIDHHPSNDYFGAVNLVDLTATSTAEALVGVFEALGESLIDEDVATCLLTGLITDTGSFQNANTTPKSLTVSAQLVASGGRQQEIVQHVYKTKPLSTLRLWGRALTRLRYDQQAKLVWSTVSKQDFEDTGGTSTDAKNVIDALMSSAPDAEIILLLREGDGQVDGSVRTTKGVDATKVVGFWNGGGHKGAAGFEFKGTLDEAEQQVVNQIRNWQLERMGIDEQVERRSGGASVGKSARAGQPDRPASRATETRQAPPQAAPSPNQPQPSRPQPKPASRQEPLTDEQLDAYFKKTSGGKGQVIESGSQPAQVNQDRRKGASDGRTG
jgi:phosphoesterase RecJ-like protein